MFIGVPKEIKTDEYRVSLIPATVKELTARGHRVAVETMAGAGAGIADQEYVAAGADISTSADQIFQRVTLIVKVKEPLASERKQLRRGQIILSGRRFLFSVAAIFVAVFILHADFHASPRPVFIEVTPANPISVRAIPVSIPSLSVSSAIHVAIATCLTVAMHSPVWTHFTVIAAHTVVVAATHHPAATHLTVVSLRLVAVGSLIPRLLGVLVSLSGSFGLRSCNRSFSILLGE